MTYRDYEIKPNSHSYGGEYEYVHNDYDGPGDDRCGYGQTVRECLEDIDRYIEEHEQEPTKFSHDDFMEEHPI